MVNCCIGGSVKISPDFLHIGRGVINFCRFVCTKGALYKIIKRTNNRATVETPSEDGFRRHCCLICLFLIQPAQGFGKLFEVGFPRRQTDNQVVKPLVGGNADALQIQIGQHR